jgi:hypothetical protein
MNLLRRGLLLSALFVPAVVAAQTSGSIQGTVTDATGAVVTGATVTATNLNTNSPRTATTNDSGFYSIPNLAPATYSVKFDKQGFSSVNINSAALSTAQALTLNATLL